MITMALGGLWHGAAWTFVLWGVYQGVVLVVARVVQQWAARARRRPCATASTCRASCSAW